MKHTNFAIKLVSLAIVAGCLIYYQNVSQTRAALAAENAAAVAAVEAYNQDIARQIEEAERAAQAAKDAAAQAAEEAAAQETVAPRGPYAQDGTFEGSALGYGGMIAVSVTIENGFLTDVTVTDHHTEDPAYYMLAEGTVQKILDAGNADVDTVSGATLSSTGIIQAVQSALAAAGQ